MKNSFCYRPANCPSVPIERLPVLTNTGMQAHTGAAIAEQAAPWKGSWLVRSVAGTE